MHTHEISRDIPLIPLPYQPIDWYSIGLPYIQGSLTTFTRDIAKALQNDTKWPQYCHILATIGVHIPHIARETSL